MKKFVVSLILILFTVNTLSAGARTFVSPQDKANNLQQNNMMQNNIPAVYAQERQEVPQKAGYVDRYDSIQLHQNAFDNKYQVYETKSTKHYALSSVEEMFNGQNVDVTGAVLRQAGYDLFGAVPTATSTTGKFDSNYKLSIGEKVNVNLSGDSVDVMAISGATLLNPVTKAEVDSKGNLFVQGIGVVAAEGKTIGAVEVAINKLAASKYKSLKVSLNVAAGQDFTVFVFGQVNKPGKVLVGNNSTIFDALNMAGGVKKTGSLRNITYTSSHKTKRVDLYSTIFLGEQDGIILRPNDQIFVNKIGNVVAVKNGVIEPGIYETKENENIQKLVQYAGGFAPTTQVSEVTLIGFDKAANQKTAKDLTWDKAKSMVLNNGDSLEFRELYNNVENIVTIQGNIKHPATYAYKKGMRLSDILKNEDELLEETFINQAVIRRVSGKDNSIETVPVFLKDFFAGMNDPLLQPRDVINIYKNTSSQFVDIYGCINKPKHLTYVDGLTLNDVMSDIQFLESDIKDTENGEQNVSYKQTESNVTLTGGTSNENTLIPAEKVAVEITNEQEETTLYYLYDIMINSDRIKSITLQPNDKIFFRTLRNNEVIKSVKVSGFVKAPGVYTSIEGKKLVDMIAMAGGLAKDADLRGIVFKRANLQSKQVDVAIKNNDRDIKLLEGRVASAYKPSEADQKTKMDMITMLKEENDILVKRYTGQIALNIKSNDLSKIRNLDNIEVQDGDDIYIPRIANQVSIMGEVYNEQSFAYKKGANVKYYIKEVGGYTPNANKFRLYKIGVNGRAEKVGMMANVEAGDIIVVPRKIAGNDWLTPVCDALRGIAALVTSAFVVTKI